MNEKNKMIRIVIATIIAIIIIVFGIMRNNEINEIEQNLLEQNTTNTINRNRN